MKTPLAPRRERARSRGLLLGSLLFVLAVACATLVPRQGWDPGLGPVVPHDTFPADCSLCHEAGDWHTLRADFTFDHGAQTGTALRGAHAEAGCLLCHNDRGPVQQFAARGCAGCHEDPHLGRLGRNCGDCHNEQTWHPREAIAQHDRTRFPLVGAHAAVACFRCHAGAQVGNFAGASSECRHCHLDDHARTTNPDHAQLGYSLDCERCHLPLDWRPARFDHPASFPLTNAHGNRTCGECHTTPNTFVGLSPACDSCHTAEYVAAVEPAHAAAGFATDCAECHGTSTFATSTWPHPQAFELTFGHAGRRCGECHAGQVFTSTPGDCVGCHLAAYQATRSPNHAAALFPQDCALCHNTAGWHGAIGEHPGSFPLENAHQQACAACHTTPGTFTGLDPACIQCHQAEYQAAADPSHTAFQLNQQCQDCHGTAAWTPSTFVHRFPITGGDHGGLNCFDCHTNPGNRSQFACIDCHEHRQSEANSEHENVQGYTWTTAACYSCHPTGQK